MSGLISLILWPGSQGTKTSTWDLLPRKGLRSGQAELPGLLTASLYSGIVKNANGVKRKQCNGSRQMGGIERAGGADGEEDFITDIV